MKRISPPLFVALLSAASLGACADSADESAGTSGAQGWSAEHTSDAGAPKTSYDSSSASAQDATSGWYDASASADAGSSGGGPLTGNADQGIGLKPGGAQDIGFFRSKLKSGLLPKPGDMTIEGWLNEHDTWLPKAAKDRLVSLHAMAGVLSLPQTGTSTQNEAVLQLGLNSGQTLQDVSTPVALTVVIDRSGSMSGDKMAHTLAGLHVLADQLPSGARIGVLSFSDSVASVYAAQDTAAKAPALHQAIDTIKPGGGTNFYAGLEAGLAECKKAPESFKFKRILMLSDGVPTVGNTNSAAISSLAKAAAAAGCSVSSIGVGLDFSPALMNSVAQQGGGTAWFLQNAEHAKQVFVQDLQTMLLPVAEKLWIQFKPAAGWKVKEIYGFNWVDQGGIVKITGPKTDAVVGPIEEPPPAPDPNTQPVAMPTLFASQRNGLVMARLSAPADFDPDQLQNLMLASVDYGYQLSKQGGEEKFTVPVQVPGLTAVPDGGFAYFASPAVRRSWILLRDGLDLIAACALAEKAQPSDAAALLQVAIARHDGQVQAMLVDLPVYDATAPDLADARQLLVDLSKLIQP